MPERFYVVEVTGSLGVVGARHGVNLTASVLDRAYCHREVRSYRSEDLGMVGNIAQAGAQRVELAREAAKLKCRELNERHGPVDF